MEPKPSVAISSDHAGFAYKTAIIEHLRKHGYTVKDFGTHSAESCDYPVFIRPCAEAVARGEQRFGIVLGGSGNGEAIVANKVRGIRCVQCTNPVVARLAREHNDANVIAFGARIIGTEVAKACLREFLASEFSGGRHIARLEKLARIEAEEAGR